MNHGERSLAELLQRTAPEPPIRVDVDEIGSRVRRRRSTAAVASGVGAVLATVAVVGGVALFDRLPTEMRQAPIATGVASPTSGTENPNCPTTQAHASGRIVQVHYVPFIVFDGRAFIAQLDETPPIARGDLGKQIATVSCRIADLTEDGRMGVVGSFPDDYLDGNAAYLEVGTPIYGVDGFASSCRVAVVEDNKVVPYLAHHEVDNHSVPTDCAVTPANAPGKQPIDASQVTVSTHCGVRSVTVKGDLWLATPPLGGHNPPTGWNENQEIGTWTVTGPKSAEFLTDAGLKASFVRAEPGTLDPNAGCE